MRKARGAAQRRCQPHQWLQPEAQRDHCVDHSDGAKSGSQPPLGVVTLFPGSSDVIAGYASHGSGAVYWAVCLYPEAPVDWKPGPDSPYLCNKTCVMC